MWQSAYQCSWLLEGGEQLGAARVSRIGVGNVILCLYRRKRVAIRKVWCFSSKTIKMLLGDYREIKHHDLRQNAGGNWCRTVNHIQFGESGLICRRRTSWPMCCEHAFLS